MVMPLQAQGQDLYKVQISSELLILLLMAILSQTLFTLVRSDLMTLSLFTARHTLCF
jgi:hypothetical protein